MFYLSNILQVIMTEPINVRLRSIILSTTDIREFFFLM